MKSHLYVGTVWRFHFFDLLLFRYDYRLTEEKALLRFNRWMVDILDYGMTRNVVFDWDQLTCFVLGGMRNRYDLIWLRPRSVQ